MSTKKARADRPSTAEERAAVRVQALFTRDSQLTVARMCVYRRKNGTQCNARQTGPAAADNNRAARA